MVVELFGEKPIWEGLTPYQIIVQLIICLPLFQILAGGVL